MTSEQELMEAVNYLSGCVYAHDTISLHLAKILIETGAIEASGLRTILFEIETAESQLPEELREGYRETIQKLAGNL